MFRPNMYFFILVMSLVFSACATQGRKFNATNVPKIKAGVTTQDEIRRWFGEPTGRQISGDGSSRWTYEYSRSVAADTSSVARIGSTIGGVLGVATPAAPVALGRTRTAGRTLDIMFDANGIVEDFSYDEGTVGESTVGP